MASSVEPRRRGRVRCYWAGFTGYYLAVSSDLQSLVFTCPLVKLKTSSEVVGEDMEPMGGGSVWVSWASLKVISGQWVCYLGFSDLASAQAKL